MACNSVVKIYESALCCGCGACFGICSKHAVELVHNAAGYIVPKINRTSCVECGCCLSVCPSNEDDLLHSDVLDPLVGNIVASYIGHAVDDSFRNGGQSGGVVSAIIAYLFQEKQIDGAIVNVFDSQLRRNVPQLITSCDELPKSFGSYYSQSAVVAECLKHRDKRLAVVTLGCQTEALKKYARRNNGKCDLFIIGLFCAGNYSGDYIDELITQSGIDLRDVEVMRFRYKDPNFAPWPGKVMVAARDNRILLPSSARTRLKRLFEVPRCCFCFDQLNLYADIAVGDPWGIEKPGCSKGSSVVLVRTARGNDVVAEALSHGIVNLRTCSMAEIVNGQTVHSRLAGSLAAAQKIAKQENIPIPFIPTFNSSEEDSKKYSSSIKKRILFSRQQMLSGDRVDVVNRRLNLKREIDKEIQKKKLMQFSKRMISKVLLKLRRR